MTNPIPSGGDAANARSSARGGETEMPGGQSVPTGTPRDPNEPLIERLDSLIQLQTDTLRMTQTSLAMEGTLSGDKGAQMAAQMLAQTAAGPSRHSAGPAGSPGPGYLNSIARMAKPSPVIRRSNMAVAQRAMAQNIGEFIARKAGGVDYWDAESGSYVNSETLRQFGNPPPGLGGGGGRGGGQGGGGNDGPPGGSPPGGTGDESPGEGDAGAGGGRNVLGRMARNQALKHVGGAIAKSGGTKAGLMAGLREVPILGEAIMAADVVNKGWDQMLGQIDENRDYQRITGTSMAGASADRLHEWTFAHIKTPFESSKEAEEQFYAATKLGYSGDQRSKASEWMYRQTKNRGMDVEQEAQVLEAATRNGVTSFNELSHAIFDVSKAAHQAGVNAEQARDKFINMFNQTTTMGMGSAAAVQADVLTSTVTSYGRTFNGVDYSGLNSRQMQYRLAAQSGMSPGQFQAQAIKNPTGYFRAVQKNINQVIQNSIPDAVLRQVAATVDKYGGTKALRGNPDLVNTVAEDVGSQGLMDLGVLVDLLTQTGAQGITQANAWAYVIQNMVGNGVYAQAADKIAQSGVVDAKTGNYVGGPLAGQHAKNILSNRQLLDMGMHSHMAMEYIASAGMSGKRDTVIEGIYHTLGSDADKARVVVQTKDGNKVVSLEQAQRDYRKELDSGKVRFKGGKYDGQTVQQVTGLGMQGLDISDEVNASKSGEKEDTFDKHHKGKGGKNKDTATLIVAPPFDQMFKVMMGNGTSPGNGLPPLNPTVNNPSARPGTADYTGVG